MAFAKTLIRAGASRRVGFVPVTYGGSSLYLDWHLPQGLLGMLMSQVRVTSMCKGGGTKGRGRQGGGGVPRRWHGAKGRGTSGHHGGTHQGGNTVPGGPAQAAVRNILKFPAVLSQVSQNLGSH
eukprot:352868-Chlamydomonas_euryale.AAC.1